MPFTTSIIKEKEEFYIKIYYFDQDTIIINYTIFQILNQVLAKIHKLKREVFYIKTIIKKLEKKIKYTLLNFYIKTNQKSDLVIINYK